MAKTGPRSNPQGIDAAAQGVTAAPRSRLRLSTMRDVQRELARIYRDARRGAIRSQDATRLAYVLGQVRETIAAVDFEERLTRLEQRKAAA